MKCAKSLLLKDSTFSSLSEGGGGEREKKPAFVKTKVLRAAAEGESGCRDSHGLTAIQMTQPRSFWISLNSSHKINAGVSTQTLVPRKERA